MVASSLNRDDKKKPMVIAIVGPTASGKSAVGLELAKRIDGEIISGDSMQVYRGMDIGTAKASREDLASVRHHLIDVVDPCDEFNVASYQKLAQDAIADITARGKMPIMVGGTGMYIDSVLNGFLFPRERTERFAKDSWRKASFWDPRLYMRGWRMSILRRPAKYIQTI